MYEIAESVLSVFHSHAKANTPENTKCAKMYFRFFFSIYLKIIFLSLSVRLGLFLFFGVIIYFRNVASVFHEYFFSLNARSWFVELRILCEPCTPYNSNWFLLLFEKKNNENSEWFRCLVERRPNIITCTYPRKLIVNLCYCFYRKCCCLDWVKRKPNQFKWAIKKSATPAIEWNDNYISISYRYYGIFTLPSHHRNTRYIWIKMIFQNK